jgi:hypothetical protein
LVLKEIRMRAVAMAPINTPDKKQWVFMGRIAGEDAKIVIELERDQFRLIESEALVEAPCA